MCASLSRMKAEENRKGQMSFEVLLMKSRVFTNNTITQRNTNTGVFFFFNQYIDRQSTDEFYTGMVI